MNSKNINQDDIMKILGESSGIKEGILSSFKIACPSFYKRNEEDIKQEYDASLLQNFESYKKEIIINNEDHISVDTYFVDLVWLGVYEYVRKEIQKELHTLPLLFEMFEGKDDKENEMEVEDNLNYDVKIRREIFNREIQSGNIQIIESFENKILFNKQKYEPFMNIDDLVNIFKEISKLFGLIY